MPNDVSPGLFKLVRENAEAIAELRKSIAELKPIVEENSRAIAELKERSEDNLRAIAELRKSISELRERSEDNLKAIAELRISISELRKSIAELRPVVEESSRAVEKLRASLEAERNIRRGEVGRLEGRIIEVELIGGLRDWCSAHGLHVERLPREPYRVDAIVEGVALKALIEIAKTGSEADIEQLVGAVDIYRRLRGEEPNALVLYIYAERPSEELVKECSEHGIIVENSPKRIAKKLAELDEAMRGG